MAVFFKSYFMQSEFQQLYRVLLPSSNRCGACGITKCSFCIKFDTNCAACRFRRCIECIKFQNSINFFYKHTSKEQWNYICNILHDLFRFHRKTREYFKDVSIPVRSSIKDTCFIISNDWTIDNKIENNRENKAIYYINGHRKYNFFFIVNNIFLEMVVINYISVSGNSTIPTKATAGSAGFDLYSAKTKEIKPWSNATMSTDLKFKIPIDMFGKIFTRSGQFIRDRVTVEGGVIDSDYRGVVKILLFNHSNATVTVGKRQRFAQIFFLKRPM